MTANAGDHLTISSISVFLIGYVIRQVQDDDDLFKSIKLNVNEFVGKADKFNIKCRYLKMDERIDNKAKKNYLSPVHKLKLSHSDKRVRRGKDAATEICYFLNSSSGQCRATGFDSQQ